jgi:mRNA-degrading endonuclease RelE of RelBE toxin-antitoxin system
MNWAAELSRSAERQLTRLPQQFQERIVRAIDELEADPLQGDVRPLRGRHQGRYRKRVGRYRIIFRLRQDERVVEISAILTRDDHTYR